MDFIVLGTSKDPHIQFVEDALKTKGISTWILDHESDSAGLPDTDRLAFTVKQLKDRKTRCLWYRAKHVAKNKYLLTEYQTLRYVEQQWADIYENIITLYEGIALETISTLRRASKKLLQNTIARNIGFNVPETTLVTQKHQLFDFFENKDAIILKPLGKSNIPVYLSQSEPMIINDAVLPRKITKDELKTLEAEDIECCPLYIQKYIEKKHEYRVVMAGDDIYPFRIDSQSKSYTKTDWRMGNTTLDFHPCQLDDDIISKLRQYMQEMGLKFGSFDFIHTIDDQIVFLECNPEGQWAWLDRRTNGAISRSYADTITKFIHN